MKVICLSCFLGGYQQTVRKRVRRSQIIWHSYCSGLTHVLTFSDDVQRKEPECNTSDSDSFAWSLEMDYTRRNYMRNGTIWTCGKFDPSTIFSSAKKQPNLGAFWCGIKGLLSTHMAVHASASCYCQVPRGMLQDLPCFLQWRLVY